MFSTVREFLSVEYKVWNSQGDALSCLPPVMQETWWGAIHQAENKISRGLFGYEMQWKCGAKYAFQSSKSYKSEHPNVT